MYFLPEPGFEPTTLGYLGSGFKPNDCPWPNQYVNRSNIWRKSPQLLVCFGAGRGGLATSKQIISHWVRDAISLAYEVRGLPSPLSVRARSTRSV